jgi:hypothetical protein
MDDIVLLVVLPWTTYSLSTYSSHQYKLEMTNCSTGVDLRKLKCTNVVIKTTVSQVLQL